MIPPSTAKMAKQLLQYVMIKVAWKNKRSTRIGGIII